MDATAVITHDPTTADAQTRDDHGRGDADLADTIISTGIPPDH